MSAHGHQLFADELARFAAEAGQPQLTAIAERIAAPLRVAVCGRVGVGRSTVARALESAGLVVTTPPATAEVVVHVIAEVVKPEDRDAIAAASVPMLLVLNKADLTGAAARTLCAKFSAATGAPAQPLVALLAVTALESLLDDTLWAALRLLAAQPPDIRSPDDFLAGSHPVSPTIRQRLLNTLDLLGIAVAMAAIRRHASMTAVVDLLRRLSGLDAVIESVANLGAEACYRRVLEAVAELEALAVTADSISDFLCCDETVIARMASAVDVMGAGGHDVDPDEDPAGHLRRAVHWQRYSRGPAAALHRRCGADIARGSLRLWSQAGGSP